MHANLGRTHSNGVQHLLQTRVSIHKHACHTSPQNTTTQHTPQHRTQHITTHNVTQHNAQQRTTQPKAQHTGAAQTHCRRTIHTIKNTQKSVYQTRTTTRLVAQSHSIHTLSASSLPINKHGRTIAGGVCRAHTHTQKRKTLNSGRALRFLPTAALSSLNVHLRNTSLRNVMRRIQIPSQHSRVHSTAQQQKQTRNSDTNSSHRKLVTACAHAVSAAESTKPAASLNATCTKSISAANVLMDDDSTECLIQRFGRHRLAET